jgi:hypothetical protein
MDAFISGGTREERKNRKKERKERRLSKRREKRERRKERRMTSSDSDSSNDANIQVYWGLLQRQQAMAQIGRYLAKIQQYRESVGMKDKKDEKITENTSLSKIKNSTVENQVPRNPEKSSSEYSEDSVSSSGKYSDDFNIQVDDAGQIEDPYQLHTDESGDKQYRLLTAEKEEQKRDRVQANQQADLALAQEKEAQAQIAHAEAEAQAQIAHAEAEAQRERLERERAHAKQQADLALAQRAHAEAERERLERERLERERVAAQIVIPRKQGTLNSGFNAYEANMPQELLEIKTRIDDVTKAEREILERERLERERERAERERVDSEATAKQQAELALAQEKQAEAEARTRAETKAETRARAEAKARAEAEITALATQRNADVLELGSEQALLKRRNEKLEQIKEINKYSNIAEDHIARHPSNLPKKPNTGFVHSLTNFFSPASAKQGETKKIYEDLEAWQESIRAINKWREALDNLDKLDAIPNVHSEIRKKTWEEVLKAQAKSLKTHKYAEDKRNEVLRKKIGETISSH